MRCQWVFTLLLSAVVLSAAPVRDSKTDFAVKSLSKFVRSGEYPGMISILYKDGIQETACIGYANVEKKIPISPDQLFMQCSQTKGFCGVTIAILVEEGKLSLDDPVAGYLPEFRNLKVKIKDKDGKESIVPAKNVLTIRMVMNHTGGFNFEIPTKNKKGWPSLSLRDTAREAAGIPLNFEPGTQAKYSNTGIDIGAAVIEVITGKPWEQFLKERVLDPLGMSSSTFNPSDEQLKKSIQMYIVNPGAKAVYEAFHPAMPLPHNGKNVHPSAGAGLWTTASDQLKFYKMLMNKGVGDNGVRILQKETVEKLLLTSTRPAGMSGYSLGLWVQKDGFVGHGGAFGTSCMVNPEKKLLQLWVVQLRGNQRAIGIARQRVAKEFFSADLDTSAADAYTGRMK